MLWQKKTASLLKRFLYKCWKKIIFLLLVVRPEPFFHWP